MPLRSRATSQAAAPPPSDQNTSAVCAMQRMRPSAGIASPARPAGCPRPSQRSSSARIASAVASSIPTSRATSAPRSQRSAINERWPVGAVGDDRRGSAAPWSRAEAPGAALRSRWRSDCPRRRLSVVFQARLTAASSFPYSDATFAALVEQPASLSSSA